MISGGSLPTIFPLVGRERELWMIQQTLDAASAGTCSALFLSGEGGVGKTRLAQLAARHAADDGWTVAVGSAYPVETGVPYALFADALVPVLRRLGEPAIAKLSRGGASQLARIFPALTPEAPRDLDAPGVPELKGRVLWSVAQLLAAIGARAPMLLVLENLHWADPSSLELLHFTVRQGARARVAVIGTYIDEKLDPLHALRTVVRSLAELGVAVHHELSPLDRGTADELLRRVFGDGAVPAEVAQRLFEWTRGNPFFVEQTIRTLVATGGLRFRDGVWTGWDTDRLELPASVRDALAIRLAQLGAPARTVADCGAVIGTRLTVDILQATTGLEPATLYAALDELCRRNVLEGRMSGARVVYDFTHPMVRDTLYGALGTGRAALLHAQVAEALERLPREHASEHVDELAFHFAHASLGELSPKAARYLVLAGRAALEKHANREAARYLRAALEQMDRAQPARESTPAVSEEAVALVCDLALAQQRVGHHDAALELWQRARADALRAGNVARVAAIDRRLGLACHWRGMHDEALRHCENGLGVPTWEGAEASRAQLRVVKAASLIELGRADEALASLRDALADAEATGDAALQARVHRALLLASIVTCLPGAAEAHAVRALELAEQAGQPHVACTAHWALAVLAGLTGNVPELERNLRAAEQIADELRSPGLRLATSEVAIEYLAGCGDWTQALARAEQSISLARALRSYTLLPRLLVWTAVIYVGRGELERGRRYLDEARAICGMRDDDRDTRDVNSALRVYMGLAMYHNAAREYDEAIRVSRVGLALAERTHHTIWAIYRLWPALIEAHLWKREFEEAERLSHELRQASLVIGNRLGLAWADAGEGLVEMLRGTTPALLDRVIAAADALERVPFVFDAARLRREIARRHAELGDRTAAVRVLERACAIFERLGARGELEGAREQLAGLGVRPTRRRPSTRTAVRRGVLTERETEVARLAATGMSDKEIGHELGMRHRTVSTHLHRIFTKLHLENRTQLAEYVRRGGLLDARERAPRISGASVSRNARGGRSRSTRGR